MSVHVIAGKGPVGTLTAALLAEQGHTVRVLSRSGGTSTERVEHRAVDAADPVAVATATADADVVYNALNPEYHRWPTDWPPMARALLSAAEQHGAALVITGNMYGYGRPTGVMTPDAPLHATDVKGRIRVQMWTEALAAHQAGRVRVTEARASDFVGPQVPVAHTHLGRQVDTLRRGRRAFVVGDPDVVRSWAYLPDVAATMVALGTDDRSWGRAWHVPTSAPRSQRQALTDLATAMGVSAPAGAGIPWPVLRAMGLAVPQMREIVAIRHQFDQEFVSSGEATTRTFGLSATPWTEAMGAMAAGAGAATV